MLAYLRRSPASLFPEKSQLWSPFEKCLGLSGSYSSAKTQTDLSNWNCWIVLTKKLEMSLDSKKGLDKKNVENF